MPRVAVQIVTWNHRRVLPEALDSLKEQSFTDFALTVVDNASTDGSVDLVREKFPAATVLRNFKNLGFSRAHNQAIQMARSRWALDDREGRRDKDRYVLVMNPDIILTPDFLKNMLAELDDLSEIGSAGGKLLKVYPRLEEHGDPRFSEIFDSIGLKIGRNRKIVDKASGETDTGQFNKRKEMFGVSGALALYRIGALDEVAEVTGEVFDEDFFAYKEDADLAWRLQLLGWRSAFIPQAVAYHYRGTGGAEKAGFLRTFSARWSRSVIVNRLSTRNHLLLLAKNEDWVNIFIYLIWILPYELLKFLYVLLFSPKVLTAYLGFVKLWPKMLKKRRLIMARRKTKASEIRKWFK